MAIFVDFHHQLWLSVFGILGNILSSIFIILTPMSTFIQIYTARSTFGFDSMPYIAALFSFMLWIYYAFIKENAILLIPMSCIGIVAETTYISIFLVFASSQVRWHALKELLICIGGFSFIFLVSWFLISGEIRVNVVGWAGAASSMGIFASPLSIAFQAFETRSVEFLPMIYLPFLLSMSAIAWLCYGFMLRDICIALPSTLGFCLGFIQTLLYAIYWQPNTGVEENVSEHVMNVEMLRTHIQSVHFVDSRRSLTGGATQTNPETTNQGGQRI